MGGYQEGNSIFFLRFHFLLSSTMTLYTVSKQTPPKNTLRVDDLKEVSSTGV